MPMHTEPGTGPARPMREPHRRRQTTQQEEAEMSKFLPLLASLALVAAAAPAMAGPATGGRERAAVASDGTQVEQVRRYRAHPHVADPSFGYYPTLRYYQHQNRCVIDLGYGRFEYCGW